MKIFGLNGEEPEYDGGDDSPPEDEMSHTREKIRDMLRNGKLESREIDVDVSENAKVGVGFIGAGMEEMGINIGEMIGGMLPKKTKRRKMRVDEARVFFQAEEAEKLLDLEAISAEALERAQEEGIVIIDEIDKIAAGGQAGKTGPDVSREGVQRDLLPIIEGTTIHTKYGTVETDHILFIAAGAFHHSKPSDLAPELQGRLPIRVELEALSEGDLVRILTEPENSLIRQYAALLGTDGVELTFSDDAIGEIARFAAATNARMENIGARRLHAMMEHLLEEVSFTAGEDNSPSVVNVDAAFVRSRLAELAEDDDARKYLL
jgi:ATP-dependent HslUV protease ATP-binding subunit HslU